MAYMIYGKFNKKSGKVETLLFDKLNQAIKWAWKDAKTNGKNTGGGGRIPIYKYYKTTGPSNFIGEVRYSLNSLTYPIYYRKYSKGAFLKTPYIADSEGNLKAIPRRDQFYVYNKYYGWK